MISLFNYICFSNGPFFFSLYSFSTNSYCFQYSSLFLYTLSTLKIYNYTYGFCSKIEFANFESNSEKHLENKLKIKRKSMWKPRTWLTKFGLVKTLVGFATLKGMIKIINLFLFFPQIEPNYILSCGDQCPIWEPCWIIRSFFLYITG